MVVLDTRKGVRPEVRGATVVVLVERRYGSRPEVVGATVLVVVVSPLSLKGKIPFGLVVGGAVVTGSPEYFIFYHHDDV